jgi:hypothetical protein
MGYCLTEILSSKTQDLLLGHEAACRKPVTDKVKHRNVLILLKGHRSMRRSQRVSGFTQNFGNVLRRDLKNTTNNLTAQTKRAIASGKVKQECDLSISGAKGSPVGGSEEGADILARQASMRESRTENFGGEDENFGLDEEQAQELK